MKNKMKKIFNNKTLTILILIIIISTLLGTFYITFLNEETKEIITISINNYLNTIQNNKINYLDLLTTSLSNKIILLIIIWLLGISLIGIPIILLLLGFKAFSLSFTFTSIIYNFKIKGIILSIIYIIPHLINLFILFILSYYSIKFSIMLFNNLFRKKHYNKTIIVKRYTKILLISLIVIFFTTLIEIYVIPYLIKYLYF